MKNHRNSTFILLLSFTLLNDVLGNILSITLAAPGKTPSVSCELLSTHISGAIALAGVRWHVTERVTCKHYTTQDHVLTQLHVTIPDIQARDTLANYLHGAMSDFALLTKIPCTGAVEMAGHSSGKAQFSCSNTPGMCCDHPVTTSQVLSMKIIIDYPAGGEPLCSDVLAAFDSVVPPAPSAAANSAVPQDSHIMAAAATARVDEAPECSLLQDRHQMAISIPFHVQKALDKAVDKFTLLQKIFNPAAKLPCGTMTTIIGKGKGPNVVMCKSDGSAHTFSSPTLCCSHTQQHSGGGAVAVAAVAGAGGGGGAGAGVQQAAVYAISTGTGVAVGLQGQEQGQGQGQGQGLPKAEGPEAVDSYLAIDTKMGLGEAECAALAEVLRALMDELQVQDLVTPPNCIPSKIPKRISIGYTFKLASSSAAFAIQLQAPGHLARFLGSPTIPCGAVMTFAPASFSSGLAIYQCASNGLPHVFAVPSLCCLAAGQQIGVAAGAGAGAGAGENASGVASSSDANRRLMGDDSQEWLSGSSRNIEEVEQF